jgi:hypothetical protein
MGYIHDTNMMYFVPPSQAGGSNGTWTHTLDGTHWKLHRAASSGTFYLAVPFALPHQNTAENRGSRVQTIRIYYSVSDADLTSLTPEFNLETLPTGAEFDAPTNPTFSYDSAHDSANERKAQGDHVMTLTLTTAVWLSGLTSLRVDLCCVAPASTLFDFWGAKIDYTLRI